MEMKKYIFIKLIIILGSQPIMACESKGSSTFWEFDQQNGKFELQKVSPIKVCHFITEQRPYNIVIKYFDKKKVVFQQKVFWPKFSSQEEIIEGKINNRKFKTKDYKILKIPVIPKKLYRFEVYSYKGKVLSKGKVNL
jgi:carbonic anhydrase